VQTLESETPESGRVRKTTSKPRRTLQLTPVDRGSWEGEAMNGYADTQLLIIKRIQADRRAAGAANRLGAERRRGGDRTRRPAGRGGRIRAELAQILVTIVLVLLGVVGVAGAGTLLSVGAASIPDGGPTPGMGA
jgi:hypothetical protein